MFPKDLLQKFTSAFSVPVQAYCKEELIFSYAEQNFSPNPAYYFMQPYIFQNHPVCFVISLDYIMSGYIMDLLVTTLQDFAQRVALCRGINSDSPTVSAICRYIEKNLYSKISTRDIAADLSLERTYLCHLFKSETGQTLMSYIQERKVREAKYLLDSTELPLAAISEQLGYSSQQQFQTTFKRITGITPRAYRIRAQ